MYIFGQCGLPWLRENIAENAFQYFQKQNRILKSPNRFFNPINEIKTKNRTLLCFKHLLNLKTRITSAGVHWIWSENIYLLRASGAIQHPTTIPTWHVCSLSLFLCLRLKTRMANEREKRAVAWHFFWALQLSLEGFMNSDPMKWCCSHKDEKRSEAAEFHNMCRTILR